MFINRSMSEWGLQHQQAHGRDVQSAGLLGVFFVGPEYVLADLRRPASADVVTGSAAPGGQLIVEDLLAHVVVPISPALTAEVVQHLSRIVPGIDVSLSRLPFWTLVVRQQVLDRVNVLWMILHP